MSLVTDAMGIADRLTAAGVRAFIDPAAAAMNRPCVLVAPPAQDFTTLATTWRLVALSSHDHGGLAAFEELAAQITAVDEVLPLEQADPASYPLTPETGAVPAYILRYTT